MVRIRDNYIMKEYATSDQHLKPGDTFPDYSNLDGRLTVVGDILDILPLGMQEWRTTAGRKTCESVARGLPKDHMVLMGNHEGRLSWLRELLDPLDVVTDRTLDITTGDGKKFRFEHGHKYTEWSLLRYVADDVVEWATSNKLTRKLWYRFCAEQGWMPSKYANPGKKYEAIVGGYWAMVLRQAHKDNISRIIGHSHIGCDISTQFGIRVIDLGRAELKELDL